MPQSRKPVPKSQKEISRSQQDPYINPETGNTLGNPNEPDNFTQFTPTEQNGLDHNRSNEMSFKGDTTKPFTIGLQDIDESIMYYFKNVIRPFVIQNSKRIAVPIIYDGKLLKEMGIIKIKEVKLCLLSLCLKETHLKKIDL